MAEDIVQEAAIVAWQKRNQFKPRNSFPAWMSEIVRLCALNYTRKSIRRKTNPADPASIDRLDAGSPRLASPRRGEAVAVTAEGQLHEAQTEFDDHVVRALESLGDVPRSCLLLRTVAELSYVEISACMQIPEGTAMSHVSRSKARLRRLLHEDFATPADQDL